MAPIKLNSDKAQGKPVHIYNCKF